MDLSQIKLSKTEWENIEIPVSDNEKKILKLICDGFENPDIHSNPNQSLFSFIKIDNNADNEIYLYKLYFEKNIHDLINKFPDLNYQSNVINTKKEPKKIDKIRIDNMQKNIEENKQHIFEYLLFDFSKKILETISKKEHGFYLYSLIQFKKSSIEKINKYVQCFVDCVINYANLKTTTNDIIHSAQDFIERNKYLIKYEDLTLFSHQKELFHLFHHSNKLQPRLVLYIAPTGTGKTLSPLGLSQGYKIIFVCVARHIGLSLAKSAVSMGKHIAFAFGCETASDIRLHNFSASSFVKHKKSGGIFKVDNSVGDKVEIMICDVKSYIVAMYYMLSFNKEEEIITYWDEPTITMDYEEHDLHKLIHNNWIENKISKFVLSCATLPKENEISATTADFHSRFARNEFIYPEINTITSYDCKKSISIVNSQGKCVLPHLIFANYRDILNCVDHCFNNKTLLRYFDLGEIVKFIEYVSENDCIDNEIYFINHWFKSISDITMISLKMYYLELLRNMKPDKWSSTYKYLLSTQKDKFIDLTMNNKFSGQQLRKIKSEEYTSKRESIIKNKSFDGNSLMCKKYTSTTGTLLTTQDAHTLTDGPTIFIAEDVLKIGKFYIQQSKIPENVFIDIMHKIEQNNVVQAKITTLEKNIEDELGKEAEKEKKMEKEIFTGEVRRMKSELSHLQSQIQNIQMNELYIPNSKDHQGKWISQNEMVENAFLPNIEEENVRRIMMLEIDTQMKVLLLLGIGVFVNQPNVAYMEIMKSLAYEQKLYLIIASSDYIYGTNYQFCHGFLGKDLTNMTQQKTIQAMGRIGRGNIQQDYTVRFRDEEMLMKLFQPIERNIEAINMSQLFSS
jgi:hypothetical protein